MAARYHWAEDGEQRVWLWISLVFALFYFGEAFLFWGPTPRVIAPPITPLVYWGAFGATIICLVSRQGKDSQKAPAPRAPHRWASAVLGIGITASVVGMAYVVIAVTQNVTLGHVILLGAMFEAAVVIGGMSGSLGWLAAALIWGGTGLFILRYPQGQDYSLGFAVAVGFIVIGLFRKCVTAKESHVLT